MPVKGGFRVTAEGGFRGVDEGGYRIVGRPGKNDRPALPAGHPESWGLLTRGTVLEGCEYPYPVFADRTFLMGAHFVSGSERPRAVEISAT